MSNRCWKVVESRQYPSPAKSTERKEESSDICENRRKKDLNLFEGYRKEVLTITWGMERKKITREQKEGEKT